jgi:hypothetical protein
MASFGRRQGSPNRFSVGEEFDSAGWKGAGRKAIDARQAQRKTGYSSPYRIAELYADLGDRDHAFEWLNTAYQERDYFIIGLRTDFYSTPSTPTQDLLN